MPTTLKNWRQPYDQYHRMPFPERLGIYLAEKPAKIPSDEILVKLKKKEQIQLFHKCKQESIVHNGIYLVPRVVSNTASYIPGTVREGYAVRNALKAHSCLHSWKKTHEKIHLIEFSAAFSLVISNIFFHTVAAIMNDSYNMIRFSATLITEMKSKDRDAKKMFILTMRITLRVSSILSCAIPQMYVFVQLAKTAENGGDTLATLLQAKKITAIVLIKASNYGLPGVMRLIRIRNLVETVLIIPIQARMFFL